MDATQSHTSIGYVVVCISELFDRWRSTTLTEGETCSMVGSCDGDVDWVGLYDQLANPKQI